MTEIGVREISPECAQKILNDYGVACKYISDILKDPKQNYVIVAPRYLKPLGELHAVPLDNPVGTLQYMLCIRNALESALSTGHITKKQIQHVFHWELPQYISDLVEK